MPEMEPLMIEIDGLRFLPQDLKLMPEKELTTMYHAIMAGPTNVPAIDAISAELIRRGIF